MPGRRPAGGGLIGDAGASHARLANLELDRLLAKPLKNRFKERGQKDTVEAKNIGYEGHMVPLPFASFTDPVTGRVRIRSVNVKSSSYRRLAHG
jgi:hypothetical protein